MSKNLLSKADHIIHFELLEKARTFPFPPKGYDEEIAAIFAEEARKLYNKFNNLKFENTNLEEAQWAAKAYQEEIDKLLETMGYILDKLNLSIHDSPLPGSWHSIMVQIIESLEGMMNSLLLRQGDLLDLDMPMSGLMEGLFVKRISQQLMEALSHLQEGTACHRTVKLMFLPFEVPKGNYYYFQIFYFKDLILNVNNYLKLEMKEEDKANLIREFLWMFNFNHPAFVTTLWKDMEKALGESRGTERVRICLQIRKEIRLSKHVSGTYLYPYEPSLISESERWLNTELNCTRSLMAAESIIAANPFAGFHVKTKLTLKQLAGVLRIFSDKGILLHDDRRELIRFFSTFFVPVSGKRFSYAALTRSFDQHKGNAILRQLKNYFGGRDLI